MRFDPHTVCVRMCSRFTLTDAEKKERRKKERKKERKKKVPLFDILGLALKLQHVFWFWEECRNAVTACNAPIPKTCLRFARI